MEYDIKSLDCSKMYVNPLHPRLVNFMEDNIPSLKKIEVEFQAKVFTKSMVYRYILLLYDPNSEIARMQADWFKKKNEACLFAGFKLSKSTDGNLRFDKRVDEMVYGKNKGITDMIVEFLAWVNNHKWNYTVFLYETMINFLRESIGGNTSAKVSKEYRELYNDFYKLSNEVGHVHEETEEFAARFYWKIEEARLSNRPEDMAIAINNGETFNSDSPYPVAYTPEKPRFLGDDPMQV